VSAVLIASVVVAPWAPARQALELDPAAALRVE
jgi:hypothetical protein